MRKRTAMQMDRLDEISSASTIAVPDVSDNTEPARTPLQSLSNPPAKRHRPSRQTGKEDKLSHGLSKAQKAAEVDAPSLVNKTEAAAPSLPPEIWRLIGEKVYASYQSKTTRTNSVFSSCRFLIRKPCALSCMSLGPSATYSHLYFMPDV